MTTTVTKPLTEQTPVEIDTQLFDLYLQRQRTLQELSAVNIRIRHIAGDKQVYSYVGRRQEQRWTLTLEEAVAKAEAIAERVPQTYLEQRAIEALNERDGCFNVLNVNREETEVFNAEFERRGGWTRAFLVTDGHVHSSMECSTCYPTTQFFWLTEFSGKDEWGIVEAAGERACTVCYPSAPVEITSRPSTLLTDEERDRNAERAKRDQEKAEREAKKAAKALVLDLSPFGLTGYRAHIETLHAAKAYLTDSFQWNQYGAHPSYPAEAVRFVAEAIATKLGTTPETELAAAQKRAKNRK